jgi:hypothetical protein
MQQCKEITYTNNKQAWDIWHLTHYLLDELYFKSFEEDPSDAEYAFPVKDNYIMLCIKVFSSTWWIRTKIMAASVVSYYAY